MAAADSITKTKPFEEKDSQMENALVPVSLKVSVFAGGSRKKSQMICCYITFII